MSRHHSYHREGKTDLRAFQNDAGLRLKEGTPTTIHHHAKEDHPPYPDCLSLAVLHERYDPSEGDQ
jgi:hypothetical protein